MEPSPSLKPKPRQISVNITDTSGNPLVITLTRLSRAGNREFASLMRPLILRNCAAITQSKEGSQLRGYVENAINSLIATGGEIPSIIGVQSALAPEGLEALVRIMSREAHPVNIDDITVERLLTDYFEETFDAIKNLIPIPTKGVG